MFHWKQLVGLVLMGLGFSITAGPASTLAAPEGKAECMTIAQKYAALGGERSALGKPTDKEKTARDGVRYRRYQHGAIYYSPATCTHEIRGAIFEKWEQLGAASFAGLPLTDERPTPNGRGRFNHFQYASIYWTGRTGAHVVYGMIRDRWAELGWERSFLGYPTTDELAATDKIGRYQEFEGGSLYWYPRLGVSVVRDRGNDCPRGASCQALTGDGQPVPPGQARKLRIGGSVKITDDESIFEKNEHGTFDVSGGPIVTSDYPAGLIKQEWCVGGEVRVELELDVFAGNNGDVIVKGEARMYEGTSCHNDDLEDTEPIRLVVPPGKFHEPGTITLRNSESDGGDVAEIKLNFSNSAP
jgi:uncharacterized protein with LGFP repeats